VSEQAMLTRCKNWSHFLINTSDFKLCLLTKITQDDFKHQLNFNRYQLGSLGFKRCCSYTIFRQFVLYRTGS